MSGVLGLIDAIFCHNLCSILLRTAPEYSLTIKNLVIQFLPNKCISDQSSTYWLFRGLPVVLGDRPCVKQPRSLASSTLDLAPLNRAADHAVLGVGQSMPMSKADSSVRMETLIDSAEASLRSNRFNPPLRLTGDLTSRVPGTGQLGRSRGTRRRLRLRWSSFTTEHASLHREARIADAFVRDLARRVPRVLQHQRWSPLNVPLLWCAAGAEETTPVLEWLVARAETMDEEVDFFEGRVNPAAVRVGWTTLRAALRSLGRCGPGRSHSMVAGSEVRRCAARQPHSTRAGTDCVGHAIRVATELNIRLTVLSIDGVGAFDHVLRAAMLSKVAEVPSLRELLPLRQSSVCTPQFVCLGGRRRCAAHH